MDSSAATATLEGRYTALRAGAADLSSDELLDVIELAQREKDAASARQAVALAHLSARESHLREDGTWAETHRGLGHQRLDAPELAAPRMGVSVHVAANKILTAISQLTRTPAVVDAMACGDLDEYRASVVTDETDFLDDDAAAEVVTRVAERWKGLTPGPLRRFVARTAAQVDPDAVAKQAQDERERRGLTRRTGTHGTDHWRGDFTVEHARGAWDAVTARAKQLVRDGQAQTLQQARADAMMELILGHCDVKVVVHTTHAADTHNADTTADTDSTGHSADADTDTGGADRDVADPSPEPDSGTAADGPPAPATAGGPGEAAAGGAGEAAAAAGTDPQARACANRSGSTPGAASEKPGAAAQTGTADPRVRPPQDPTPSPAPEARGAAPPRPADTPKGLAEASKGLVEVGKGLVEVGGMGASGTTFVPRDWLERALNHDSDDAGQRLGACATDRTLTCEPVTGALLAGDVPEALASGRTTRSRTRPRTGPRAEDPTHAYRIPAAMARLVRLRDGCCRFPGCSTPARQCDLDHVTAWPAGPTAPHNLMALCRRHHRIKQTPRWHVTIHPDATVTWTDPTGYRVSTRPVDHLHLVTATATATAQDTTPAAATGQDPTPATGTSTIADGSPDTTQPASSVADALARYLALPTTFEEQLHDLLTHHPSRPLHARPDVWDADGTLLTGPPPHVDLETGRLRTHRPGPGITVLLHHPPRPAAGADTIPF